MSLERRRPLRRGKGLARSGRVNPVSAKRRAGQADQAAVRDAVFRRDRYACQVAARVEDPGRCYGPMTPHHRRKAGQQGAYTAANLVTVCAHHNERLEADPDLAARARAAGLVVRPGDPEWETLGP